MTRNTDMYNAHQNGAITEAAFQAYKARKPCGKALCWYANHGR